MTKFFHCLTSLPASLMRAFFPYFELYFLSRFLSKNRLWTPYLISILIHFYVNKLLYYRRLFFGLILFWKRILSFLFRPWISDFRFKLTWRQNFQSYQPGRVYSTPVLWNRKKIKIPLPYQLSSEKNSKIPLPYLIHR